MTKAITVCGRCNREITPAQGKPVFIVVGEHRFAVKYAPPPFSDNKHMCTTCIVQYLDAFKTSPQTIVHKAFGE